MAEAVRPDNTEELVRRVVGGWERCELPRRLNSRRANVWGIAGTWIRVLTALAAALSALSVVTSVAAVTVVLTITTAVLSALNATLDPAGRAERHRKATKDYARLVRRFEALDGAVEVHNRPGLKGVHLDDLVGTLLTLEAEADKVDESAPPVSGVTDRRDYLWDQSWSWWKVHRLKRQLKWKNKADAIMARAAEAPDPDPGPDV
jgi:hypothetical protein